MRVTQHVLRHSLGRFTLDVPHEEVLLDWAATPQKSLPGQVVFYASQGGQALETLAWEEGYCVGYQEEFASGDLTQGAYVCHLTLAATALSLRPGGPGTYLSPVPGTHGTPQQALVDPLLVPLLTPATTVTEVVLPTVEELAATTAKALAEAALAAAATAALPVALTLALLLGSSTPAGGPGIDQHLPPPLNKYALRLLELEEARKTGALSRAEQAELIALLATVRGVHVAGPHDLAYLYSQDIAFNQWWDSHAPPELRQLDLEATMNHVEYRDYTVPRGNGIGGAHNAVEWGKHQADYVESSHVPHPTVPGVTQIEYRIYALNRELQPIGQLKAKVYPKTVYDPQIWPRPRLERALKQSLQDAYLSNGNSLPREWSGTTAEGYTIRGFYDAGTNSISTFFFEPTK